MSQSQTQPPRRRRGFTRAGGLIAARLAETGGKRGFAVARLLTNWADVVGPELARIARPVKVGFGRDSGIGATLTLVARGADAPRLQAETPKILARVNAAYGYAAIARIRISQTAETGFAEAPEPWVGEAAPDPAVLGQAREAAAPVNDPGLRRALEELGGHVLGRRPD